MGQPLRKVISILLIGSAILLVGCSKEEVADKNSDLSNAGAVAGEAGKTNKTPAAGMTADSLSVPPPSGK